MVYNLCSFKDNARTRIKAFASENDPAMTEGGLLSDMVAVLSSLNVIAGELDR